MNRRLPLATRFLFPFVLVAALLGVSSLTTFAQTGAPPVRKPIDRIAPRAAGHVIVKFAPNASVSEQIDIVGREQLQSVRDVGRAGARLYRTVPGRELATIDRLRALAEVEYAEPDYVARADLIPNDPLFVSSQLDLTLTGVPTAWNTTTGSSAVAA